MTGSALMERRNRMAQGEANKENIIFAIEHCLLSDSTICEGCYQDGPGFLGITCKRNVIRDALVLMKNQPLWISVEDRMPPELHSMWFPLYGTLLLRLGPGI